MKILIADDHDLVREMIANFITTNADATVEQASTLEEALGLVKSKGPFDLVLLDYVMPGMNGLDGVESMLAAAAGQPVALFSGLVRKPTVQQALEIGAAGFVPKTLGTKSLIHAIRFMAAGEKYIPFEYLQKSGKPTDTALTERELSVLDGLCDGKANKTIASDLGLQEVTIKLHVKSICRKLGARNRTHAAMIARELRLA